MSYYVTMDLCDVVIPVKKVADALKAINDLCKGRCFQWVSPPPDGGYPDLQVALKAWRYDTARGTYGDIEVMYFNGENLGDDETLWSCLAPYVSPQAFINCKGEEDSYWRWAFDGTDMEEIGGAVVYGTDERPLAVALNQVSICLADRKLRAVARITKATQIVCEAISVYSIRTL